MVLVVDPRDVLFQVIGKPIECFPVVIKPVPTSKESTSIRPGGKQVGDN